jgi:hypothetical protein
MRRRGIGHRGAEDTEFGGIENQSVVNGRDLAEMGRSDAAPLQELDRG